MDFSDLIEKIGLAASLEGLRILPPFFDKRKGAFALFKVVIDIVGAHTFSCPARLIFKLYHVRIELCESIYKMKLCSNGKEAVFIPIYGIDTVTGEFYILFPSCGGNVEFGSKINVVESSGIKLGGELFRIKLGSSDELKWHEGVVSQGEI